jgi:acetyl-CoA carboxylase biotin carboxylase subunit
MFQKILIANRGEIALRVLRACKELGIATVAVHSTADADAMHVRLADESVCIGPPPSRDSYLNIPQICRRLRDHRRRRRASGLRLPVGERQIRRHPRRAQHHLHRPEGGDHIRIMGDKIEAKRTAKRLGIPCVPGSDGAVSDERSQAMRVAKEIGYPVLIKAAAGGGGRGMKVARTEKTCEALATARGSQGAPSATTPSTSRSISKSRATSKSRCSATARARPSISASATARCSAATRRSGKRRPRPRSTPRNAHKIGEDLRQGDAPKLGYSGAGTIEFLYENGEFYFIEMNTRLQVEHPVTEAITGIDLVHEQIRVASGGGLSVTQDDVKFNGHAIECRINAEDPRTFTPLARHDHAFPSARRPRRARRFRRLFRLPHPALLRQPDRQADRARPQPRRVHDALRRALDEFVVDGIKTTLPLFRDLVGNPDIANGDYDIHWLCFAARPEATRKMQTRNAKRSWT